MCNRGIAGDVDTCKRLLGQGLSVETNGPDGRSLLYLAVAAGHVDVVRLLLQLGANVRSSDVLLLASNLPEPTSSIIGQLLLQADAPASNAADDGRMLGTSKKGAVGGLQSLKDQIMGVFSLRKWVKEPEIRKMEADVEKARKLRHKLEGAEVKADDSLKKLMAKANEFIPDVEQVSRTAYRQFPLFMLACDAGAQTVGSGCKHRRREGGFGLCAAAEAQGQLQHRSVT
jgi:hypothetical protein